jgi:peptidoglycan/xylan/chitin deacetylase (PgdA/CDA1 family)
MFRNTVVDIAFIGCAVIALILINQFGYSWWLIIGLSVCYGVISVLGSLNLDWGYFVNVKSKGAVRDNRIALTFDDGPLDHYTPRILSILKEHNVKATFFCIGYRIELLPHLVQEMDKCGHVIGNHSYYHRATFPLQRSQSIIKELKSTNKSILKVIGKKANLFRPPFGITHPFIANAVLQTNHVVVGWSVRSFDTVLRNPDVLLARILKRVKGGDVILLHDFSESTITILPILITRLKAKGYTFVTVDDLVNENAYV